MNKTINVIKKGISSRQKYSFYLILLTWISEKKDPFNVVGNYLTCLWLFKNRHNEK